MKKDPSTILGKCYICQKNITAQMITNNKALYIGKGVYRCRSKKCQTKILDTFLAKHKPSKTWKINSVTKIISNKKNKTRNQIKKESKKRTEG